MPKMKTHRAAAKRYRLTGAGKLRRNQTNRSHLNVKKTSKRKRQLDCVIDVHETNLYKIAAEIPYPKYIRS